MTKQGTLVRELGIERRLLRQYREEKITLQQLADVYDVSISTIWRALARRGIRRGSRRGRPRNHEKHRPILPLVEKGLSRREIADQLGVTPEWVRSILAERGLTVSLQILKCSQCGICVATGHKAHGAKRTGPVLCANCLRQDPQLPFARRLQTFRLQDNLSRAELSQRSGLSKALIGNYERGEARPTTASARKLAEGLGVSLSRLVGQV